MCATRLTDAMLIEELLVLLALGDVEHARSLTVEVVRRGLVEQAQAAAAAQTAENMRRLGRCAMEELTTFDVVITVVERGAKGATNVIGEWQYAAFRNAADAISAGQHVRTHKLPTTLVRKEV